MGFEEGDMENIVNLEVGWKGEPKGDGIDALRDTKWSQLLVIKFRIWTSSRDVSLYQPDHVSDEKVWSGRVMAINLRLVSITTETKLQR